MVLFPLLVVTSFSSMAVRSWLCTTWEALSHSSNRVICAVATLDQARSHWSFFMADNEGGPNRSLFPVSGPRLREKKSPEIPAASIRAMVDLAAPGRDQKKTLPPEIRPIASR